MGRKKHTAKDVEKYRAQAEKAAATAKAAADQATASAKDAAKKAQDWAGPQVKKAQAWAGPQVGKAVAWGAPKAERAYHAGARKASPYVRRAGDRATEWSDIAHAAIVGAAIPAVISAVESAAVEPKKKSGGVGKVLVAGALVAAGTAALVVWARRDPGRDEWAGDDEWQFDTDGDVKQQLRDNVNKAVDQVTSVAKKGADAATTAGKEAFDKASPAIDKVAGQAQEALDKVKSTASSEAEKVKTEIEEARSRATHAAVDAIDDAEDVWEDEGATDETPTTDSKK